MADTYSKHSLDKEIYKNKMVLIVGGGNSAFEIGDHLSGAAAIVHIAFNKRIQFAWDTHYVGKVDWVRKNHRLNNSRLVNWIGPYTIKITCCWSLFPLCVFMGSSTQNVPVLF